MSRDPVQPFNVRESSLHLYIFCKAAVTVSHVITVMTQTLRVANLLLLISGMWSSLPLLA